MPPLEAERGEQQVGEETRILFRLCCEPPFVRGCKREVQLLAD